MTQTETNRDRALRETLGGGSSRTSLSDQALREVTGLGLEEAVDESDITAFLSRHADVGAQMTRNEVVEAVRFDRRFPGGAIQPGPPPGAFDRVRDLFASQPDRKLSLGQRIQEILAFQTETEEEFQAGFGLAILGQQAAMADGLAILARRAGAEELAANYRSSAEGIRRAARLAMEEPEGIAGTAGQLIGNIFPSALSLGASGAVWSPVIAYYAIVELGGGSRELREQREARGLPDPEVGEEFAVAVGYSLAGTIPEVVGLKALGSIGRKTAQALGDAFMKADIPAAARIIVAAGGTATVEGTEEVITEFIQNAIAGKGIPGLAGAFDPGRPLTENLRRVFLMGAAGGGILVAPAIGGQIIQSRRSPSETEIDIALQALRETSPREPGAAQTQRVRISGPLPRVVTEPSEPIQRLVSTFGPQEQDLAEQAMAAAVQSEALSREERAKAQAILDEIDSARLGVEVERVVERRPATQQEITQFWERVGLHAGRADQVMEAQHIRDERRTARMVAKQIVPTIRRQVEDIARRQATVEKGVRQSVRRLVRSLVPADQQGRFLQDVESPDPGKVRSVLGRIELAIAQGDFQDSIRDMRTLQKQVGRRKLIDNKTRDALRGVLAEAEALGFEDTAAGRRRKTFAGTKDAAERAQQFAQTRDQIRDKIEEAGDLMAEVIANENVRIEGELRKITDLRSEVVRNVAAPLTDPFADDVQLRLASRVGVAFSDLRNLSRFAENKTDDSAILEQLMWREMARAHDAYLKQVNRRLDQLEDAAKRAGFRGLAHAFAAMSGHAGKGNAEVVEAEIEEPTQEGEEPTTRTIKLSLGHAAWFYAIDAETEALILGGAPVQLAEKRRAKRTVLSEQGLKAIRDAVPQNIKDFIDEGKAIAEQDFPDVARTVFRLRGIEPTQVQGYFRRRRNIAFTETAGMPEGFGGLARRYLENLGFTREREGGIGSPILIEDFLGALVDHIGEMARVQHVAEPTRTAAAVLLTPEVQTAITDRHGEHVVTGLIDHLEAGSLVNRTFQNFSAQMTRFLNSSLAVAKLGLNPSSILRQLGGLSRLMPILGAGRFQAGMAGVSTVTMKEMTDASGFFWERYVSNVSGRWSPVTEEGAFGADKEKHMSVLDDASRNIAVGDIKGAYKVLREAGLSTLEFINFFDSINARVAWAGYTAEINQRHPEWSAQRRSIWVAERAEDAVRETQNSSSVLDMSTLALRSRGEAWSMFLLFSSDRFKTWNRVRRAVAAGNGFPVIAAELGNILWSRAMGTTVTFTIEMLLALAFGDEDDREKAIEKATALDRQIVLFLSESVGMVDPLVLPNLTSMTAFHQAQVFDSPAISSINDMARAIIKLVVGFPTGVATGDREKVLKSLVGGIGGLLIEAGALTGLNPLDTIMRRILRQAEASIEDSVSVSGESF